MRKPNSVPLTLQLAQPEIDALMAFVNFQLVSMKETILGVLKDIKSKRRIFRSLPAYWSVAQRVLFFSRWSHEMIFQGTRIQAPFVESADFGANFQLSGFSELDEPTRLYP